MGPHLPSREALNYPAEHKLLAHLRVQRHKQLIFPRLNFSRVKEIKILVEVQGLPALVSKDNSEKEHIRTKEEAQVKQYFRDIKRLAGMTLAIMTNNKIA